jgi:hypothetical protein
MYIHMEYFTVTKQIIDTCSNLDKHLNSYIK